MFAPTTGHGSRRDGRTRTARTSDDTDGRAANDLGRSRRVTLADALNLAGARSIGPA